MASEKNQNSKNRPRRDPSSVSNDNPTKDGSHSITATQTTKPPITIDQPLESSTNSPKQKTTAKSTPKSTRTRKPQRTTTSKTPKKVLKASASAGTKNSEANKNSSKSTMTAESTSATKKASIKSNTKRDKQPSRLLGNLIAAGIGGVVVLIAVVVFWYFYMFPSLVGSGPNSSNFVTVQDLNEKFSELEARQDEVELQLSALPISTVENAITELMDLVNENQKVIQTLNDQLTIDITNLSEQASGDAQTGISWLEIEKRMKALTDLVNTNNESIKTLESLVLAQSNSLESVLSQVNSLSSQSVSNQDQIAKYTEQIEIFNQRISKTESKVDDLSAEFEKSDTNIVSERSQVPDINVIAVSKLKDAVFEGKPFENELAAIAELVSSEVDISLLQNYAEVGIPTKIQLVQQFPLIARSMNTALNLSDGSEGFFDNIVAGIKSRVVIRRPGEDYTTDPSSQIGEMSRLIANSSILDALGIYENLPEAAKVPAEDWVKMVRVRLEADELINIVSHDINESLATSRN